MIDYIQLIPYRAFPSLPAVGGDVGSHTLVLSEAREAIERHERRRGDPLDSFVRIRELINVGVLAQLGDRVVRADDTVFGGSVETEFVQDTIGAILVDTSSINFTYSDAVPSITAVVIPAGVDHDALANFVANEHVDHTAVTLTAGAGLTGGGDISASRTFNVGAGTGITVNADDVALSLTVLASLALADSAVQPGDLTQTFLTMDDETASLPNSRQLVAGGGIVFDDMYTGEYVIRNTLVNLDLVTFTDETAALPNSRRLVAGANVTFDITPAGQLVIAASSTGGNTTATYLTLDDETGDLPNSRQLVAGGGIALDDMYTGELVVRNTHRNLSLLTANDESADLPNSRQLVAGANVVFGETYLNELRIQLSENVALLNRPDAVQVFTDRQIIENEPSNSPREAHLWLKNNTTSDVNHRVARFRMSDMVSGADQKSFDIIVSFGGWGVQSVSDDGASIRNALIISKAAGSIAVTGLTYGNSTDLPPHTFHGNVTVSGASKAFLGSGAVPSGGTTSQVLKKNSNTDYDYSWQADSTGGGGGSATEVEVDLGATAKARGFFTITDAGISGTSKVLVWVAGGPYTGKGTRADESEFYPIDIISVIPGAGSARVNWQSALGFTKQEAPHKGGGTGATAGQFEKDPGAGVNGALRRLGLIRGNVKFHYAVFG